MKEKIKFTRCKKMLNYFSSIYYFKNRKVFVFNLKKKRCNFVVDLASNFLVLYLDL